MPQVWSSPVRFVEFDQQGIVSVRFASRVGERECCVVQTTYVCTQDGAPTPWPDDVRSQLTEA